MNEVVRVAAGAVLCTLFFVPHASCHSRSPAFAGADPAPIHPTTAAAAAAASNRFGFDVYARMRSAGQNLIFSPISASLALAMAAAGAKGGTLSQMSRVLHVDSLADAHAAFADLLASFPDPPDLQADAGALPTVENVVAGMERSPPRLRPAVLHLADRVWAQARFTYREDFLSILRDRYRAPLGELDFERAYEAARVEINGWVGQQTRGRIPDLLAKGTVNELTRLVLTNAVYFKASWLLPFTPSSTSEADFATPNRQIRTKMMRQLNHFSYAKVDDVSLVELPYFGGSVSMVVVLPEDAHGLTDVENRITHDYDRWIAALADRRVDLWLPPWKATQSFVLDDTLKALGMPLPFDRQADFSGMTDMPTLDPGKFHIGTVIQKAFVDVDEFGTEAAAATAVVMMVATSLEIGPPPDPPVVFHADHPFLYVIRERSTGAVVFVGRVVDP